MRTSDSVLHPSRVLELAWRASETTWKGARRTERKPAGRRTPPTVAGRVSTHPTSGKRTRATLDASQKPILQRVGASQVLRHSLESASSLPP